MQKLTNYMFITALLLPAQLFGSYTGGGEGRPGVARIRIAQAPARVTVISRPDSTQIEGETPAAKKSRLTAGLLEKLEQYEQGAQERFKANLRDITADVKKVWKYDDKKFVSASTEQLDAAIKKLTGEVKTPTDVHTLALLIKLRTSFIQPL